MNIDTLESPTPVPNLIKLRKKSRDIELCFADDKKFNLSFEYLRVFTPSAEAKDKLVIGKKNVTITGLEPVGSYALKIIFDDGHQSGLYTWEYLYDLAINYQTYWSQYMNLAMKFSMVPN